MHEDTALPAGRTDTRVAEFRRHATGRTVSLRLLHWWLCRNSVGRIDLTLPSGARGIVGSQSAVTEVRVAIRSSRALWSIAGRGALGLAESYMAGDIATDDIRLLFAFYLANEQAISKALPSLNTTRTSDRRFHVGRANTRAGSRRNIADHYDLGNRFYRLWLDPSMLYSSGLYTNGVSSLEDAQQEKVRRILSALALAPGDRVLEVGCGWGALALAMADQGAHVKAITISAEQLAETRMRVSLAGRDDRVEVASEDYRDTTGTFDRLVSIEMIEAVGEENWPTFFKTISNRLKPGGHAVIQAITIREDAFAQYRRNPDFIQRYIFPGGMLPTVALMRQRAGEANMSFEIVEQFAASYARTLAEWRRRFEAAWPEIAALGFDERFRRMWHYYLAYCEIGFERGLIDVGLYRLQKRD